MLRRIQLLLRLLFWLRFEKRLYEVINLTCETRRSLKERPLPLLRSFATRSIACNFCYPILHIKDFRRWSSKNMSCELTSCTVMEWSRWRASLKSILKMCYCFTWPMHKRSFSEGCDGSLTIQEKNLAILCALIFSGAPARVWSPPEKN